MSRVLAVLITLAAGFAVGLQPPSNAEMARHVGDFGAALMSVLFTLTVIVMVFLIFGDIGRLHGLSSFRPQWTVGGISGAIVVTVALVTVRTLGAAAVVALLVAAQLIASVTADRLGWFGVHHVGLSAGRIAGVLLAVAGTVLVTRS
ncbi:MAG TPA: DMT family transporter [Solirubrobacteraceae bacterium]|nr:DMT family transporter [Solirubrobacteraceae bacterium]